MRLMQVMAQIHLNYNLDLVDEPIQLVQLKIPSIRMMLSNLQNPLQSDYYFFLASIPFDGIIERSITHSVSDVKKF